MARPSRIREVFNKLTIEIPSFKVIIICTMLNNTIQQVLDIPEPKIGAISTRKKFTQTCIGVSL